MDAYTGFAQVYDLFMIMCPMMNGVHIFVRH